jgi:hypothetical protein
MSGLCHAFLFHRKRFWFPTLACSDALLRLSAAFLAVKFFKDFF